MKELVSCPPKRERKKDKSEAKQARRSKSKMVEISSF
jgi:hypothetical protein